MWNAKSNIMSNIKGYTLLELLIVLIIISSVLIGVSVNFGSAALGIKVEQVAAEMAYSLADIKRQAQRGSNDPEKLNFSLSKADIRPHSGVVVTTQPPNNNGSTCQARCDQNQAVICVSNQPFCFSTSSNFSFDRFGGTLKEAHAIFILSKNRQLALLVDKHGDFQVAEFSGGQWRSRTDLQNLFNPSSKGK